MWNILHFYFVFNDIADLRKPGTARALMWPGERRLHHHCGLGNLNILVSALDRQHQQSGWVSRALDLPHCLPHKVLIRDLVLLLAPQKIDAFFRSA
jgi:hypothetical protein